MRAAAIAEVKVGQLPGQFVAVGRLSGEATISFIKAQKIFLFNIRKLKCPTRGWSRPGLRLPGGKAHCVLAES